MEVYRIAEGKAGQRSPAQIPELLARRDGMLGVDIPESNAEAQRVIIWARRQGWW